MKNNELNWTDELNILSLCDMSETQPSFYFNWVYIWFQSWSLIRKDGFGEGWRWSVVLRIDIFQLFGHCMFLMLGPGALRSFSPNKVFLGERIGPFGPLWVPKRPRWVQMTHDDVFYPCEMFWGHLELLSASFEVPGNFIQWNPEFWHFWDGNFECLKMVFFGVRLKFAPLFLR